MLFIALIAKAGNYVTPTDQGVYRIINLKYNLAMAEDFTGSKMICDEIGHANQGAINMIGNTEISNNLFSNMVLYKFGRYMSRGGIISETSKNYENKVPIFVSGKRKLDAHYTHVLAIIPLLSCCRQ